VTQQPWGQQPQRPPAGPPAWGQPQQVWGQSPQAWGQPAGQRPAPGYPPVQQQPYGAPQPAYQGQPGGYPPPPPQRSGSPIKLVLLGLVAVIAVGFFFISLMNYLNGDEQAGPLPTPEVGATSAPPTGVPEPDLNPPEWPTPTDGTEAEQWLVNNPLYGQSVQVPTNCTLGRIDVLSTSPQALEQHLNNLTGCLMMVWQEPMEQAGFVMPRPPVTVYSQPITTACGEMSTHNAFYCTVDQRVYFATDLYEIFGNNPEVIDNAFLVDNVIGHEFGHAIQARSGIWASYAGFRAGSSETIGLEFSRRSETQADCFSGMFLNAVAQASQMTDAERAGTADVTEAIGDDNLTGDSTIVGDHGHGVNRRSWFEAGMASDQVGVCNTWTAPADKVR
jgi:predicted metalloprotease